MFGCGIPITVWVSYAGATVEVFFCAVIREGGGVVGKICVADVSNMDPGIDGAESTFGCVFFRSRELGEGSHTS